MADPGPRGPCLDVFLAEEGILHEVTARVKAAIRQDELARRAERMTISQREEMERDTLEAHAEFHSLHQGRPSWTDKRKADWEKREIELRSRVRRGDLTLDDYLTKFRGFRPEHLHAVRERFRDAIFNRRSVAETTATEHEGEERHD